MAPPDIPDPVRHLIREHIESASQLDVLLLLRAAPEKWWTVDEVARARVARPEAARGFLDHLQTAGLLATDDGAFRYAPQGSTGAAIDSLAECYATRRQTVVGLIFTDPEDAVTSLADAFRLRRKAP